MRWPLLVSILALSCGTPGEDPSTPAAEPRVEIVLEPIGPDPADVDVYQAALTDLPDVAAIIEGRRRLLSFELLPEDVDGFTIPGSQFEAMIYDYTANQNYLVTGDMDDPTALAIAPTDRQPAPSLDEFDEAVAIALESDPDLAAKHAAGEVSFFNAMPPLIESADGDRVISLGIFDETSDLDDEVAGANLSDGLIIHYDDRAPPTALAVGFVCNPPPTAAQSGSGRGTQGWARLRLRRGGQDLWTMMVRRPSASSGTDGSGVELLDVRWRGVEMLEQAHLPILNVIYENNVCGPYRDWQWQENAFQIGPTIATVGDGIVVTEWAKTIRELNDDTGNHVGVAIYWDDAHDEGVIVSELAAGWYRYPSEWRFTLDGEIKAQFGFSAVQNGCTCQRHDHHAYWRFDWDLGGGANSVEQWRDSAGSWTPMATEFSSIRDDADGLKWRVINNATGNAVELETLGPEDPPEQYGIGDFWAFKDNPNEIDDSSAPGSVAQFPTQARIPFFENGESLVDEDIVTWWSGHFVHDDADPATNQTHTVRMKITPNW